MRLQIKIKIGAERSGTIAGYDQGGRKMVGVRQRAGWVECREGRQ